MSKRIQKVASSVKALKKNWEVSSLDDLLNSEYYDSNQLGAGINDMVEMPEGGPSHSDTIQDWRDILGHMDLEVDYSDLPLFDEYSDPSEMEDELKDKIHSEIDTTEEYHDSQGTLDDQPHYQEYSEIQENL